jgi:hypothetical protein
MANRGKRQLKPVNYLLHGNIVKCGYCDYAMNYDKTSKPVYRCYHTIADNNANCHKHKISVSRLDEIVLAVIRKKAELVLNCADQSKLRHKTVDEQKLANCEKDIAQNADKRQQYYERFRPR